MDNQKSMEHGIQLIEVALKNGLRLVPNGKDISIKKASKGYNAENKKIVTEMLRQGKNDVLAVISDQNTLREELIEAHRGLSEAYNGVMVLLDLFDRLQNIEEIVYPGKRECLYGDEGCPGDAIVYCNVCARKKGWKGGYSE